MADGYLEFMIDQDEATRIVVGYLHYWMAPPGVHAFVDSWRGNPIDPARLPYMPLVIREADEWIQYKYPELCLMDAIRVEFHIPVFVGIGDFDAFGFRQHRDLNM